MSSAASEPPRFMISVTSAGATEVSTSEEIVALIWLFGVRFESSDAAELRYHQSRSLLPSYAAETFCGSPLMTPSVNIASVEPLRSSRPSAWSTMLIEPLLMPSPSPALNGARANAPVMAPPRRLAVQNESVSKASDSELKRMACSNSQVELQPSVFVVLPSSHCSAPARTPSPQTIGWHSSSQVVPFGGSHPSPCSGSTMPSPQ